MLRQCPMNKNLNALERSCELKMGYARLAYSVLYAALYDLISRDPQEQIDAALYLLEHDESHPLSSSSVSHVLGISKSALLRQYDPAIKHAINGNGLSTATKLSEQILEITRAVGPVIIPRQVFVHASPMPIITERIIERFCMHAYGDGHYMAMLGQELATIKLRTISFIVRKEHKNTKLDISRVLQIEKECDLFRIKRTTKPSISIAELRKLRQSFSENQ